LAIFAAGEALFGREDDDAVLNPIKILSNSAGPGSRLRNGLHEMLVDQNRQLVHHPVPFDFARRRHGSMEGVRQRVWIADKDHSPREIAF
jgi:hypothetical protein